MAAIATFALKAGVWFRRGRLVMVSPDSLGTACPLSGRNSTYRPVQISETSSWPHTLRAGELADQAAEDVRIFLDYCGGELEFTILGAVGAGGGWRSALARWR